MIYQAQSINDQLNSNILNDNEDELPSQFKNQVQSKSKKLAHFEENYNKQITPNDFRNQN